MFRWISRAALAALTLGLFLGATPSGTEAQSSGLRFPAPKGTEWQIIAGYNTATHSEADGDDPYAIDVIRTDGTTEHTPVLAPISGTVGYIGSNCFSVRTDDVSILMCHVIADPGMERGERIGVGQRMGYIAPPGEAGNNGYPHIHIALEQGSDPWRHGRDRDQEQLEDRPLPFTGDYEMEGVSLPRTSASNGHYNVRFVSTNDPSLSQVNVSAGDDQTVDPSATVTLEAGGDEVDYYLWEQIEGPTVGFQQMGEDSIAFVAPAEAGSVLRFRVTGYSDLDGDADVVKVTVRGAPIVDETTRGTFISGAVPSRGIGLVVFGGGTNEELIAASTCDIEDVSFFVANEGKLIGYIPAAQVELVNARWNDFFPDGLPGNLPLIVRCG